MIVIYVITNDKNLWDLCQLARNKRVEVVYCQPESIAILNRQGFDLRQGRDSILVFNRLTRRNHQIDGQDAIIRHIREEQRRIRV